MCLSKKTQKRINKVIFCNLAIKLKFLFWLKNHKYLAYTIRRKRARRFFNGKKRKMFKFNVFRYLRRRWVFGRRAVKVLKQINFLLHATQCSSLRAVAKKKTQCEYLKSQKQQYELDKLSRQNCFLYLNE